MSGARNLLALFQRQPVRLRIAVVSGVLTAVILIGFAAVVGGLVSDRLTSDFRDDVSSTADQIANALSVSDSPTGRPILDGLDNAAMATGAQIAVVDRGGDMIATAGRPPDFGPPRTQAVREAPGDLEVADRLIFNNTLDGFGPLYVQSALDRSSVNATIERLWIFLSAGVVVGTLLAGFAGMAVAGRTMRPISRLTSTARTIANTRDPSMRIPEIASDDEVAELARTLDQMLRELDAARSETEATVSRQREFVADASHELRTPLTSILANLEMLEAGLDGAADPDELAATHSALRSSRRMSRLVADLLMLARADAGRFGEQVDCDLARICREAFEEVDPVATEHDLDATLADHAPFNGNRDELHRMIVNLLENAIKHTPHGSAIELELAIEDEMAVIGVDDAGAGLPEGMEQQVFDRFVRGVGPADRAASRDGTGLGLSIVRAVAETHGGTVTASRSPLGGARFRVELPLAGSPEKIERTLQGA